jgi:hypothetical protein
MRRLLSRTPGNSKERQEVIAVSKECRRKDVGKDVRDIQCAMRMRNKRRNEVVGSCYLLRFLLLSREPTVMPK